MRGFFAVGVYHPKHAVNIGTLWRTAHAFGAALLFTVGARYDRQSSDTTKAWRHVPLIEYPDIDALVDGLPYSCPLVGVELHDAATPLGRFEHPERAAYLLGAEDHGLPPSILARCHHLVVLPGEYCLNVATAGSIVAYDRIAKAARMEPALP